ncbi:MAG: hypothetical protein M9942_11880 [Microthrixaceae bacterium]|nr:hypothetical protein [Microthrixaceae bacterium]
MTGGAAPTPGSGSATTLLWEHRDRRVPPRVVVAALTGRSPALVEDAARITFALSGEFDLLLGGMPERVRSLPSHLGGEPERMTHSVRGPVMWSETMTARANSFGGEDVFVCRSVRRDFDCAANRLLVWMLERTVSAARLLRRTTRRSGIEELLDAGTLRRVEEVGAASRAWRHVPRLAGITPGLPDRLELRRIRRSRHDRTGTEVLLAARNKALQPFGARDVAALANRSATAEHEALVAEFRRVGGPDFVVSCVGRTLECSGVKWRHGDHRGPRTQPAGS